MTRDERARVSALASREMRHDDVLQRVAYEFWVQQRTQQEIADDLAFSRVSISRLLDEARRRGVVRFDVGPPVDRNVGLERELTMSLRDQGPAAARHLRTCRVVTSTTRGSAAHRWRLGVHAAAVIAAHVRPGGMLAIASSRTTAPVGAAAHALPALATVAELLGSGDRSAGMTAGAEIAAALGATHLPLPAPFIHRSDERAVLAQARVRIRAAIDAAAEADVAVFGAGSMERFDGTGAHAPVSARTLQEAAAAGAVGHCLGVFLDDGGRAVASELDTVRVGVGPRELRQVPCRVLIAWTSAKAAIIRAVIASGLVTDLVTDDVTARSIIASRVNSSTG